jgi:hypothetical protein
MIEDSHAVRALVRAIEALTAETKVASVCGRIALDALARGSSDARIRIGAALDAEVLERRTTGSASDLAVAAVLASTRSRLGAETPVTADEGTLERVLIEAARRAC